jgi:carbonic anhydrase
MHRFPKYLRAGYRDFIAGRFAGEHSRYEKLAASGQTPETLIIGCCDSRAAPETVFNTGPGEIFVVRNVANLVPPYDPDEAFQSTPAALEFAVQSLKVTNIVVMGHANCGGVHAALSPDAEPLSPGNFIGKWMSLLKPVADTLAGNTYLTDKERHVTLERAAIRHSIANLRTYPCVYELEDKGKLHLHGAWFDISTGELWIMDGGTGDFARVDPGQPPLSA